MTSGKLIFLASILLVTANAVSKDCVVELGKLSIELAKLYADVHTGRVLPAAAEALVIYKESKRVQEACQQQPAAMLLSGNFNDQASCIADIQALGALINSIKQHAQSFDVASLLSDVQQAQALVQQAKQDCQANGLVELVQKLEKELVSDDCEKQAQAIIQEIQAKIDQVTSVQELVELIKEQKQRIIDLYAVCKKEQNLKTSFVSEFLSRKQNSIQQCFTDFTNLKRDIKNTISQGHVLNSLSTILLEIQNFAKDCKASVNNLPDIKECLNRSETFYQHGKAISDKINAGQDPLDNEFIDEVVGVAKEVDTLLAKCKLSKAEKKWVSLLPEECITDLGVVAHDGSKLRDDQSKPIAFAKDLLKFKTDYKKSQEACPFLNH